MSATAAVLIAAALLLLGTVGCVLPIIYVGFLLHRLVRDLDKLATDVAHTRQQLVTLKRRVDSWTVTLQRHEGRLLQLHGAVAARRARRIAVRPHVAAARANDSKG